MAVHYSPFHPNHGSYSLTVRTCIAVAAAHTWYRLSEISVRRLCISVPYIILFLSLTLYSSTRYRKKKKIRLGLPKTYIYKYVIRFFVVYLLFFSPILILLLHPHAPDGFLLYVPSSRVPTYTTCTCTCISYFVRRIIVFTCAPNLPWCEESRVYTWSQGVSLNPRGSRVYVRIQVKTFFRMAPEYR